MDLKKWDREFDRIKKELAPLGLRFDLDAKARDVLGGLIGEEGEESLRKLKGKAVVVFGNADGMEKALARLAEAGALGGVEKIAADNATKRLLANRIVPSVVCTDLDGDLNAIAEAGRKGAAVVVHAHGDNIGKIRRAVERLEECGCRIVGTTQARPTKKVHNYYGFTDGDRALFLAKRFGARKIGYAGFSFRKKKYAAAKRLIGLLKKEKKGIYDLNSKKEFLEFVRRKNGLGRVRKARH